jgi:hypothetical protein
MANFKSGNCLGGIRFLANQGDFEPSMGSELRDRLLDHVRHYHYQEIVQDLKSILEENKLNDHALNGCFLLAGYLKDEGLPRILQNAWNAGNKKGLCPNYLWAIINCVSTDTKDVLVDGLTYFMALPDEGDDNGYPKGVRNETAYEFSRVRWNLTDQQVLVLDELFTDFEFILLSVFELLDHPLALERTIGHLTRDLDDVPQGHSYSVMVPDDKWSVAKCGYRIPERSLNYLKDRWTDRDHPPTSRLICYNYWADNARTEDVIKFSKLIGQDDNVLYRTAIQKRVRASDFTVVDQYIPLVGVRMAVQYAYYVWTAKLKKQCSNMFQLERDSPERTYMLELLTKLLKRIPVGDAEELLMENWDIISSHVFGLQTALYIQTEKTLQLVDQAIKEHSDPSSLFSYMHSYFGFWDHSMQGRLNVDFLKGLNPYLQYLSDNSVKSIAQISYRLGYSEWVLKDLLPFLKPEQQRFYYPDASDLLAEMRNERYNHHSHGACSWIGTVTDRRLSIDTITPALKAYAKQAISFAEFKFLADCVSEIGTRKHLTFLDDFEPSDEDKKRFNDIRESVTHTVKERSLN